jgi:hypothetical protein
LWLAGSRGLAFVVQAWVWVKAGRRRWCRAVKVVSCPQEALTRFGRPRGFHEAVEASTCRWASRVSAACRTFGVHRSTYYAWKRQVDRHGLEMLRPRERRRRQMPNALPKVIEERVVSLSFAPRPWA